MLENSDEDVRIGSFNVLIKWTQTKCLESIFRVLFIKRK